LRTDVPKSAGRLGSAATSAGPSANLVCVLHFHQPTGVPASILEDAFDDVYEPLLDRIAERPRLKLNLHFTGTILEHALARRPAFLDRLRSLWKDERIELLGGAFHDPVLTSIPERDAIGQLQFTANFFNKHFGRIPKGAWLCLRAWDPSLVRSLVSADIRYTLLDDAQFVIAGLHPDELYGHYVTERAGHPMSVFAIDAALVQAVEDPVEDIRGVLRRIAEIPGRAGDPDVLAADGHELFRSGRIDALIDVFDSEYSWVKTMLMEHAWDHFAGRGRVYLPSSSDPSLGEWCRPAAAAERRREFARDLAVMGVWEQAQEFVGGVVWDNFLVKYPEVNRIHKRMLRVSQRIDALRSAIARRHRSGGNVDAARQVLATACGALWRSQNHSVYWHGGRRNTGIYDPALRQQTLRDLLIAERTVDRVIEGRKPPPWTSVVADHDADGRDEVLVRTAHFAAIVHPGAGGVLSELDLRQRGIALLSALSPVEEPYHTRLVGNEVALVPDGDEGVPSPPGTDQVEPLLAGLTIDKVPRGSFQDHFLGPETTLESFARRQFRELGDFTVEPYDVMKTSSANGGESGAVVVGRSGVVRDTGHSMLLRVEKTFRFDLERPRITVHHALFNRSRDPATTWFGLELTFGLPGSDPSEVTLKTLDADDNEQVACLADGPVDLGDNAWLEWEDRRGQTAIVVEIGRPMGVWWVPVTTVHEGPDGLEETVQGNTLLLHAPMSIWGQEQQELQLRVDFIDTSG